MEAVTDGVTGHFPDAHRASEPQREGGLPLFVDWPLPPVARTLVLVNWSCAPSPARILGRAIVYHCTDAYSFLAQVRSRGSAR